MLSNHTTSGTQSSGTHQSFWLDSCSPIKYEILQENTQADVVIIGGGVAGVSVAYNLCKIGKRVILVEDGYIGSGETGRTTAHLTNVLDDRYYELERIHGEDISKLAAQSHTEAIIFVEKTIQTENIDCQFKRIDGFLFQHPSDRNDSLEKEYEAAIKAGLTVEKINKIPGLSSQQSGLKFRNQGQFHPLKYLKGLCESIIRMGGRIYTQTHINEILSDSVITNSGITITAEHIVVATNAPFSSKFILSLKQFAYRTYAIAGLVEKSKLPTSLWWDTGNFDANEEIPPYHYVRTEPYNETHDLLISGGEDHPVGLADAENLIEEQRYEALETWTKKLFPVEKVLYRWSGQVMEPIDSLAYIGKNPADTQSNIFVVSGDSGNGMTYGTIAGILIADLIAKRENPWAKIYSPSRFAVKKSFAWVKEFSKGFIDYLKTQKIHDPDAISSLASGNGIIVKIGGEQYGVHRDAYNDLHIVSAKCTHLGCTVKWNTDEKSWDCPCHGSRFGIDGEVLNGPANTSLEYFKEKDKLL